MATVLPGEITGQRGKKEGQGRFGPNGPSQAPEKRKKVAKVVGERERESYLVIRFAVGPLAHSNFTLCASCRYFHNRESSLAPRNVGKTSRHLYSRIKIKCLTVGGRPSLCNQKKKCVPATVVINSAYVLGFPFCPSLESIDRLGR